MNDIESKDKAIQLSSVIKEFMIHETKFTILKDISFSMDMNNFIIFTGPSGSGKSTILNILGGLTKISSGMVKVLNHKLNELSEEALACFRSIFVGFVFQTGHLIDSLTIYENLILPVKLANLHNQLESYSERVWKLLEEFGISDRANSLPRMISGGEYQRAVFIRSLVMDPDLLLIDEPTSNQDNETTQIIIDKLASLKNNKSIVVVSHDKRIFGLADNIYAIRKSKIVNYEGE